MWKSSTQLVAGYFEMWNSSDVAAASGLIADVWLDHAHPDLRGPEAVAATVVAIRKARPALRFTIEALVSDDPTTVVAIGTAHTDDATSEHLVWIFRVEDGKLSQVWTYRRL
jgi:predicted SnoaL-like aldol condensation-catalyzing enzyme